MFEKLYRDEELLGIFHILDLLSDIYVDEWKKEAKDKIRHGLKEYGTFIFKKGMIWTNMLTIIRRLLSRV